ncbi:uncharacterized protein RJT20DRAFT_35482 [Scheffersomyces xylosifermentans]|uniref:uncharacterized protein n=1 Tax=Scheffersomyces xylosifermentans TaxID=1304137 RepID=UPI00315DC7AC
MPIDIISSVLYDGPEVIPGWDYIKTYGPPALTLAAIKYYFAGASNTWERDLHGKVYIITGGTTGLGAQVAYELATRGAQLILLVRSTEDIWVADFVEDLRDKTNNILIYAEQCDLNSLHSVRLFATKWLDNQPPRRLDGVVCCAAESIPRGKARQVTVDGVERQLGINYLANFHLLTLLGPSLKVQPPDRDVRVILATCSTQSLGDVDVDDLLWEKKRYPSGQPWKVYGSSKLLLGLFAKEYQRRLNSYERKDKAPCNIRINLVNPGLMRTASTRRFISMGTILGLIFYMIFYPIFFLFFKSARQGAQSVFFTLFAPIFPKLDGGNLIQECKIITKVRTEMTDEGLQKEVFEKTEELIEKLEKQSAIERKKQAQFEESKKPLAEKIRAKNAELERKSNIYEKPATPEELDLKLNRLRQSIGMGGSGKQGDLPLFPDVDLAPNSAVSSGNDKANGNPTTARKNKPVKRKA